MVAFIALQDVRQHRRLVRSLAPGARLQGPAAGPDMGVRHDKDFHVSIRADHGSNVAAIQHRPRRIHRKLPLKIDKYFPDLGNCRDHRGRVAHFLGFQDRIAELFGIEFHGGGNGQRLIAQVGTRLQQGIGDRAIDHAGIEVAVAVVVSQPLAERALARCRGTVDGDDHAYPGPAHSRL